MGRDNAAAAVVAVVAAAARHVLESQEEVAMVVVPLLPRVWLLSLPQACLPSADGSWCGPCFFGRNLASSITIKYVRTRPGSKPAPPGA